MAAEVVVGQVGDAIAEQLVHENLETRMRPEAKEIIRGARARCAARAGLVVLLAGAAVVLAPVAVAAQQGNDAEPWFGLVPPPEFEPHVPPAILGDRGPAPARVPPGEEAYRALEGPAMRADLETIVGFSRESRERREVGDGQLWGRITGLPSGRRTIRWAAERLRDAGIPDVRLQSIEQDDDASFWLPTAWTVTLLGDPAFGPESRDVVLETAMPLVPSEIEGGALTAPLVHVGTARPAQLEHVDVRGKVAVQRVTPQAHTVFERSGAVSGARALMDRGAVAVLTVVDLPGNERARDFANCGGPCFNLGGRDGRFVEGVLDRSAEAGVLDRVRVRIELETEIRSGLTAENAVGVLPGSDAADETVIVNAHADAWFDGAGDNGDGLAVMLALARHFADPEHRPRRTFVFLASAGHHSPGLHGPRSFVAANPDLVGNAVLVINVEHVAQRNLSPARSAFDDGYRAWVADATEAPVVAGISNSAPFLEGLVRRGVERYGTNFVSGPSTMSSGEGGGYRSLGVPILTTMQAPPLYHTSGEVLEVVSVPGLERMARFLAFFLDEVDRAPRDRLDAPSSSGDR